MECTIIKRGMNKREKKKHTVELRFGRTWKWRSVSSGGRLDDYQLSFGVFGNQLHQAAVGGTFLSLGPLVEQLSEKLERRPGGRIRIRHPFAVHRRIKRDRKDGHDERIVRHSRFFTGQTFCQLMHGCLRHTVPNHARCALERRVRSRQH
uniref:Uncharacterized protein n=1 Tax=Anopheles christyi TaxID=43041 RepID=A0A182KHZ9_9DIPT